MITTSQMYWLTRLDTIHELTQGLAILGTIAFVILCIIAGILTMTAGSTEEHYRAGVMRKCWYGSMFVLAVSASLYAFTPTTKEMAAIIIIPRLANSTVVTEKLPAELSELYSFAKQYLITVLKNDEEEKEGRRGRR